jgi:hypothetical protein
LIPTVAAVPDVTSMLEQINIPPDMVANIDVLHACVSILINKDHKK